MNRITNITFYDGKHFYVKAYRHQNHSYHHMSVIQWGIILYGLPSHYGDFIISFN